MIEKAAPAPAAPIQPTIQAAPAIELDPIEIVAAPVIEKAAPAPAAPIQPTIQAAPAIELDPIEIVAAPVIEKAAPAPTAPIQPTIQAAPAIEIDPIETFAAPVIEKSTLIEATLKSAVFNPTKIQLDDLTDIGKNMAQVMAIPAATVRSMQSAPVNGDIEIIPNINTSDDVDVLVSTPLINQSPLSVVPGWLSSRSDLASRPNETRTQPLFSARGTLLRLPTTTENNELENTIINEVTGINKEAFKLPLPGAQSPFSILNTNAVIMPPSRPLELTTILQPGGESRLAEPVKWLVQTDVNMVELKLHPPSLGALDVRVTMDAEKAHVQFVSSSAIVRDVLEVALPRLRDSLAQDGLQLGSVSISDQLPQDRRSSEQELTKDSQRQSYMLDDNDEESPESELQPPTDSLNQLDDFA